MTDIDRDPTALADIHSHLVPGVDDGAKDLDETLGAVERLTRLGIRKILTTPHLKGSLTHDADALAERLDEVTEAWGLAAAEIGRRYPEVDFKRGHEVMLDVPDVDFSDPRIRLAGTPFVLIEWPRLQLPPGTVKVLRRILDEGYQPIIAHPERYFGIDRALNLVEAWRDAGAYLQLNYGSLSGRYGPEAKLTAFRLLRRGWADYFSSDFHASAGVKIYQHEAWERLEALGAHEALTHLCLTNPSRVFRGEAPLPVPLLPAERGFWARVRGILNPDRR
jgi:protein-tyrosine phosphatase